MAKKWKKKIEDYNSDFKFPKFDEKEYLQKELKETRILLVTVMMAVVFAFISLSVMAFVTRDFLAGFAAGILGIVSLRYVYPAFKIDISSFEPKKWVINSLTFFGIWLSVWILLCNPPISDFTPPSIKNISVIDRDGKKAVDISAGRADIMLNATSPSFSIEATISDNNQMNSGSVGISIVDTSKQVTPKTIQTKTGEYTYRWDVTGISPGLEYIISISAGDTHGNKKTVEFRAVCRQ